MYRIAIVEDDKNSQEKLQRYLDSYAKEYNEVFETTVFSDGKDIVRNYTPYYDMILLDVHMKNMDGFSAAKHIRAKDENVILIFITNMAQYAIKGYEVNATSYLLKPVQYFAFSQELKRSFQRVRKSEKKYLLLPIEHGVTRVDIDKILFIESEKNRVLIYTENQIYSIVSTIKGIEEKLSDRMFFRCNSGYLVNLSCVTDVQGSNASVGNFKVPISRPKKKAFMMALTDYLGGTRR